MTISLLAFALSIAFGSAASADTSVTCSATTDLCQGANSRLFAIARDAKSPDSTVLYRVTIPPQSTGTNWGDGHNGFFFRVL